MLKNILFGGESGLSPVANAGMALLRIFTGVAMAAAHGLGKIPVKDQFVEGVAKLGFPLPAVFAWAAALSEFAGGILLALGLLTRISAFFVAFTMFIAAFVVNYGKGFDKQELAILYMVVAVFFMLKGAGDWSVDGILRKR